jgi:hypothetical protein
LDGLPNEFNTDKNFDWRRMRTSARKLPKHEDVVIKKGEAWKNSLKFLEAHLQNNDQKSFHRLI